ncbi:hypothetical protein MBRA1_000112 [Malassezia brasiliensis]|uniref:Uncharacterized protein n=1 Tax=Malassezia brasiliensis TaxID=1821822 RepID=A0AAF0DQE3_9BASI|nr:hypothetical protein MBRA1_000112 [Malassezia brasiliensis]
MGSPDAPGHGYSNSYSKSAAGRPLTARHRHPGLDRPPSDEANVPEDVSVATHAHTPSVASDLLPTYDDEEDDVFAFLPPSVSGVREKHTPHNPFWDHTRTTSFDLPRDEADACDDDDAFDKADSRTNTANQPLFDRFSWTDSFSRFGDSRDGKTQTPNSAHHELPPSRDTYGWDTYGAEAAMPSGVHYSSGMPGVSLHRTKSVGEYSDVPSTAHSIAIDSVVGDMTAQPRSRFQYAPEDTDSIPLHVIGKRDAAAEPHDSYVDPDPEIDPEEDSPYAEVRASVSNIDDPSMPAVTLRMWFLALLLSCIGGAVNTFLSLRFPSPLLSPVVLQLLAYFMGKFLAYVLPIDEYYLPWWLGGFRFTLNPGAFNIKEHALITIMINITISQAYAINFLLVTELEHYYNSPVEPVFEFIFAICSQVTGFGIAGFLHRFLVWPADMVWPQTLVTSTILNTLHAEEEPSNHGISRLRWFVYTGVGACVYNFLPNYFFNALSQMCWVCWIAKDNITANIVTGVYGMGLTSLTFDWSQASYLGSPLVTPWWAEMNIFGGFMLFMWIFAPALYFSNAMNLAYFPFNMGRAFDRFGQPYKSKRVIDAPSFDFDQASYEQYSPIYLPATFVLSYFTGFMTVTAIFTHAICNHGSDFVRTLGLRPRAPDDIHAKLMRRYKPVPVWWYQWLLVVCLIAILVVLDYSELSITPALILLALVIPALYALPSGYVYALSGQMIGTNIVGDIIAGYLLNGHPKSFLLFKTLTVQTLISSLGYTSDMKVGHYMKLPPRAVYAVQLIGALAVVCVQLGVKHLMVSLVSDLCEPGQQYHLTCQSVNVFYASSMMWGVIGPQRVFSEEYYRFILYGLLVGAILPVLVWLVKRRYPRSWVRYVSVPVFFAGAAAMPASTSINFTSFFVVAFVFQYYLRKHNFRWWSKYNFVTANALDAGTIISELLIFFVIQLPSDDRWKLSWWGNTVMKTTADFQQRPLRQAPPEGLSRQ